MRLTVAKDGDSNFSIKRFNPLYEIAKLTPHFIKVQQSRRRILYSEPLSILPWVY